MKQIHRPSPAIFVLLFAVFASPARIAPAADGGCSAAFTALDKSRQGPTHVAVTRTRPGDRGKPESSEAVYAGGKIFMTMKGQWKLSPMSIAEMQKQQDENRRSSKTECRLLREEPVEGETASVFHVHSENDAVISDGDVWVSRSRGLVLREEVDLNQGDSSSMHMSMRYDYRNVQVPRL